MTTENIAMKDLGTDALTQLWILSEERPDLREQARVILQERIPHGAFALEDILALGGRVINVWFTATTPAFETYGQYVTGTFIIHPSVTLELLKSPATSRTKGTVLFNAIDEHLTNEQKKSLENIGFHTTEVLRLTY